MGHHVIAGRVRRVTVRSMAVAVVVLLSLAGVDAAYGCTCSPAGPLSSAAVDGEEFFVARVISIGPADPPSPQAVDDLIILFLEVLGLETPKPTEDLARVQVLEVLRGSARLGVADVLSGISTCGYGFVPGETYLIDAWRNAGTFATSICFRTRRAKDAAADLRVLRRRS